MNVYPLRDLSEESKCHECKRRVADPAESDRDLAIGDLLVVDLAGFEVVICRYCGIGLRRLLAAVIEVSA